VSPKMLCNRLTGANQEHVEFQANGCQPRTCWVSS